MPLIKICRIQQQWEVNRFLIGRPYEYWFHRSALAFALLTYFRDYGGPVSVKLVLPMIDKLQISVSLVLMLGIL